MLESNDLALTCVARFPCGNVIAERVVCLAAKFEALVLATEISSETLAAGFACRWALGMRLVLCNCTSDSHHLHADLDCSSSDLSQPQTVAGLSSPASISADSSTSFVGTARRVLSAVRRKGRLLLADNAWAAQDSYQTH